MDLRPPALHCCILLSFWLLTLAQRGVNVNSLRTMETFKITQRQKKLNVPDYKCGSKTLRKRSSPYDTWLTGFEPTELNCQIIELTPPVPTVNTQPSTKAGSRTTVKAAATTRQKATDVKVGPTNPLVAGPEEESRLFYLAPFVPFSGYIPTVRYQDVTYYTHQYGSYVPFYGGGYYPPLGADAYYNLLMFGKMLRDGSSEEEGRWKREASNLLKNTSPRMAAKHKKGFIENLFSHRVTPLHRRRVDITPGLQIFRRKVYPHSYGHSVFKSNRVLGKIRVKEKEETAI